MKRCWIGSLACFLAYSLVAGAQITNGDFETGDLTGWTITAGTAFNGEPSTQAPPDAEGTYMVRSRPENATGTLVSDPFVIDNATFRFLIAGHRQWPDTTGGDGTVDPPYNWVVLRDAETDEELTDRIHPPGSDPFVEREIDVANLLGREVYIEIVDNSDATGYAWIAVDSFSLTGPSMGADVLEDFEDGPPFDARIWSVEGVFNIATYNQGWGAGPPQGDYHASSSYDGVNNAGNDVLTGTLTSGPFMVGEGNETLMMLVSGHNGPPDQNSTDENYVSVRRWEDDSEVARIFPPRSDASAIRSVNVSAEQGKALYLHIVDSRADGFGWLAVDYIRLSPEGGGHWLDVVPPVISRNGNSIVYLMRGDAWNDPGATAIDDWDGDLTSEIIIGGDEVDTETVGNYFITYDVADAAGNQAATVTRTVIVTEEVPQLPVSSTGLLMVLVLAFASIGVVWHHKRIQHG